jgi:hypothetical protein
MLDTHTRTQRLCVVYTPSLVYTPSSAPRRLRLVRLAAAVAAVEAVAAASVFFHSVIFFLI